MPILTEFPEIIEKHSQMQRKQEDLSSIREFKKKTDLVSKCLDNLLLFCNNKLKSMITVDKQFGHVVALRQKILREQLFIDALADILNNLFVGNFHLAKITALNRQESEPEILVKKSKDLSTEITKTQLQVILSISKKIYALLEMICKGNKENQQGGLCKRVNIKYFLEGTKKETGSRKNKHNTQPGKKKVMGVKHSRMYLPATKPFELCGC